MTEFLTHIESAIDIWRKTVSYDYSHYSQLLHTVFKGYHVESKEQINTFRKIYELTVCDVAVQFYYKMSGEVIDVILYSQKGYKKYQIPTADNDELSAFNLPENVKNRVSRTYRALKCCKFFYPAEVVQENVKWADDFQELLITGNKGDVVSDVIQAALFLKKRDFEDIHSKNLYFHITKSLLNAEYLLIDNYSDLLKENVLFKKINSVSVILPWYAYSFVVIAQYLNEMCLWIDKTIREEASRRIIIDSHVEEYTLNRFPSQYLVGEDESKMFDIYVKSVIEMTLIDHIYVINTSNMEKLLLLWRRAKAVEESNLSVSNKRINKMVQEKVANMICSITDKSYLIQENCYFTLGSEHGDELLDTIKRERHPFDEESNPFLKIKKSNRNKELSVNTIQNEVSWGNINSSKKDVCAYNYWVSKGWQFYCELSQLIQLLSKALDQLKKLEEYDCHEVVAMLENCLKEKRDKELTSSFFLKAITFCNEMMKYNEDTKDEFKQDDASESVTESLNDRLMSLLLDLLSRFKSFTSLYKAGIRPPFIPTFADSYYTIQDDQNKHVPIEPLWINAYNKDNFTNFYFYASIEASIQNPSYFNRLISENMDIWNEKMMGKIYSIRKDVSEVVIKENIRTDEVVSQMRNENLHTRNHTMQLMGLFAAFIALITSTIGSIRVAHSVPEFIVFLLALTLCVVIFATLISFLGRRSLVYASSKEKNKTSTGESMVKGKFKQWFKQEEHWDWFVPFVLALFLFLALAVMLKVYDIPATSSEPTKQNVPAIMFEQHNNNQEYHSNPFQK